MKHSELHPSTEEETPSLHNNKPAATTTTTAPQGGDMIVEDCELDSPLGHLTPDKKKDATTCTCTNNAIGTVEDTKGRKSTGSPLINHWKPSSTSALPVHYRGYAVSTYNIFPLY